MNYEESSQERRGILTGKVREYGNSENSGVFAFLSFFVEFFYCFQTLLEYYESFLFLSFRLVRFTPRLFEHVELCSRARLIHLVLETEFEVVAKKCWKEKPTDALIVLRTEKLYNVTDREKRYLIPKKVFV